MENEKTLTLGDLVAQQATKTRSSDFTTFTSKKKFTESEEFKAAAVASEVQENLKKLVNISAIALHADKVFAVLSLYDASTKAYSYIVLNLKSAAATMSPSVKEAKNFVRTEVLKAASTGIAPDAAAPADAAAKK